MEQDIRWEQRLSNFKKALHKLEKAVEIIHRNQQGYSAGEDEESIEEVIREGLIQRFEYTHELAWNVMKDYAEYQGNYHIKGSRDATRLAFKMGLIADGEIWMDMLKSRNETSHTYNEEIAKEIYDKVIEKYLPLFEEFDLVMEKLKSK
ncbi:MAG: nucleotidyltransferase substrate binding protein [Bacteroidales bacterium]|nr:nucleotidyltransferase substrate binding protein [Bacteroidales bacterium]